VRDPAGNRWKAARRRVVHALLFGLLVSLLIAELIAANNRSDRWNGSSYPRGVDDAPPFVGDPPLALSGVLLHTPSYKPNNKEDPPWYWPFDQGMDCVSYKYQAADASPMDIALWKPGNSPMLSVELNRDRFGWPMRMVSREQYDTLIAATPGNNTQLDELNDMGIYRRGIKLPWTRAATFNPVYLPIQIRWTGLAVNTLFWSLWWLIPAWLLQTLRARRRLRRGLCPVCGYTVEELDICPECGCTNSGGVAAR